MAHGGFPIPYLGEDLDIIEKAPYSWQTFLFEIMSSSLEPRNIYWIYDPFGNQGKSSFVKYCMFHKKVLLISLETSRDILYLRSLKQDCLVVMLDLTRSKPQELSFSNLYSSVEQIKNGCFVSTKYIPVNVLTPCPHVMIFANSLPEYSRLSQDRWKTLRILKNTKDMSLMTKQEIFDFKEDYVDHCREIARAKLQYGFVPPDMEQYVPSFDVLERWGA